MEKNKDSVLKKEFKPKDVNRLRNIITGKTGNSTQIQSGYENKNIDYQEGDIWEEGGKKWTIKDGLKQSITKMDDLKKLVILPLTCPHCSKPMKVDNLNKKMYNIHKMCFDCVIDMEAEIKKQGKYEEYVSLKRIENRNTSLSDLESQVESWLLEKNSYITEAGDIESWEGGDKTKLFQEVKDWIKKQKELPL